MLERRRIPRTQVSKDARIILSQPAPLIDCTVCNLTNLGVCLQVPGAADIAGAFDLTFDLGRSFRSCRLIWKTANKLGVAFG